MFQPKYTITQKILDDLAKIEEAKLVSRAPIKGSLLNPDDWIFTGVGSETENYKNTIAYISELAAQRQKIIIDIILKIHHFATKDILEETEAGHFRDRITKATIRRGGQIIAIRYTDPDPDKIPQLLADLLEWIEKTKKEDINPVLVAGIALIEFLQIHPFIDGNGRTGRALATLLLYENGYDFRKIFALEDYYNSDRDAYLKAINIGKNYEEAGNADLTNWLEYFVEGVRVLYNFRK